MKTILILILTLLLTVSKGQEPSCVYRYELKAKSSSLVSQTEILQDTISLNPIIDKSQLHYSVLLTGLTQNFQFNIGVIATDTLGYLTAFTYSVRKVKPTKADQQLFPDLKIDLKEEFRLVKKITSLPKTLCIEIINTLDSTDLNNLPTQNEIIDGYKSVQVDGTWYFITKEAKNKSEHYRIGKLYISKSKDLNTLATLDHFIRSYIDNNANLEVEYKSGFNYNSRHSSAWVAH